MASKRKRSDEVRTADIVHKPAPGTKSFTSGAAVRDGLGTGTRQALVSFHQQIVTPYSSLPLPITHATVLMLQHYLDVSPTVCEIFNAWQAADETKNDKLAESATHLLALIIRILTPLPFFHKQLVGIVTKLVSPTEPWHELLPRLVSSGKRENSLAGLALASAAVHVDAPDPTALMGSSRGRLASRLWQVLSDGGAAKTLGRLLPMRRRNKEGETHYNAEPMDHADMRHLAIDLILPLLPTAGLHTYAKNTLPQLYSGLSADPPATVYRVLNAIWAAVSGPPPGLARRISLVLLDEKALEEIGKQLDRGVIEPSTGRPLGEIVEGFLEGVTATPGRGVCFTDAGWYPREEEEGGKDKRRLHNRILSNVVRKLGARVVDDQGRVGAWALTMFGACPELVSGYWAHSALSLEPRLDARWIATMAYVGRVVALPLPKRDKFNQPAPRGTRGAMPPRPTPPPIENVVESVLPAPMTKAHLSKGLQAADGLVQHVTALALARGLQKLSQVQQLYATIADELEEGQEGPWRAGARELEAECRRRVPEVPVIIAFAQKAATMGRPATEDEEVEPALAARSAMLTEAALRLFGLYHRTLPSLAGEARFDVGKLLVSASSANAERRARREAREGSVVSDSGSVGSIGTIGTVGMGGGFGHARGNVEGFEALSQLHVLRLLADVRDWTWTNKASGSQFTYLYHILQLHLSTRNVVTQAMTTTLLHRLLLPSLLFEHDALELPIWLDALPRPSEANAGPMFLAQQIHLLSFMDECVRRALKTPHRYIEEAANVIPTYSAKSVASPLLMTMAEQLHAKLLGMHIATEAAGVVLHYLRRVLVGLLGKQADDAFVRAIIERLDTTVKAARDAGQPRHGLAEIVELMENDLDIIYDHLSPLTPDAQVPRLIDEDEYAQQSFVRQCLAFKSGSGSADKLEQLIAVADEDEKTRQAQFLVHFLSAPADAATILDLLRQSSAPSPRLKSAVFNDSSVRKLLISNQGKPLRSQLAALVSTLSPSSSFDRALAETYTHEVVGAISSDDAFARLAPWIPFLSSTQVSQALKHVVTRMEKKNQETSETAAETLCVLVRAAAPEQVNPHLHSLLALGAYRPVAACLRAASRSTLSRAIGVAVDEKTLASLLADDESYAVLALLVKLSPATAKTFSAALGKHPKWIEDVRILPAVAALPSIPDLSLVAAAVDALKNVTLTDDIHLAAASLLGKLPADDVNSALGSLQLAAFCAPLSRAAVTLSKSGDVNRSQAVQSLLDLAVQWATRRLSSDAVLAGEEIQVLKNICEVLKCNLRVEPQPELAEAAITAVIAERLSVPVAMTFAARLASKTMLKASFVRQQLHLLFASKTLSRLALPTPSPQRLPFIRLVHALCMASTYVSAQPNFVEPLLPLYRGTMALSDRLLLSLFKSFEQHRHLSATSILQHWSSGGGVSSRAFDAVVSLDAGKVFSTSASFPLRLDFGDEAIKDDAEVDDEKEKEDGEEMYDPVFVLSLLGAAIREGLGGLDWVEILRSNTLGLAVCALSSKREGMRTVAGHLLSTAVGKVQAAQFHEGPQLQHTLELVSHALPAPSGEAPPRLPPLMALFIAHALRTLAHPASPFYPLTSRFLLQRPVLDIADVPLLYSLLYSSSDNARRERAWIVRLLRDGVRSTTDVRAMNRRNALALLAGVYQGSLDRAFRRLVLQAFASVARIAEGAHGILRLLGWFRTQWGTASADERRGILDVLDEAVTSLVPLPYAGARQRWALDMADFVALAADDEYVSTLSRIALRVAHAHGGAVPVLLRALGPMVEREEDVEMLFRVSLLAERRVNVASLAAKIAAADGDVGVWAREEALRV